MRTTYTAVLSQDYEPLEVHKYDRSSADYEDYECAFDVALEMRDAVFGRGNEGPLYQVAVVWADSNGRARHYVWDRRDLDAVS